jgi:hypothetical protein
LRDRSREGHIARLRHLARQLHRLGERPLFEFLAELDAGADFWPRLEAYAALEPYQPFIQELDGDQLPRLKTIGGGRR